eukprot:SAG25_NODE_1124_length_3886_cov_1.713494_3_plen_259_part_00
MSISFPPCFPPCNACRSGISRSTYLLTLDTLFPDPQHAAGTAIANALLGHCDDGHCWGRLPYTWPRDLRFAGAIGDYKLLGTQKTFRYGQPDFLYPFGFGLKYGEAFVLHNITVASSVAICDSAEIAMTLHNQGSHGGSEVLQVYLRWLGAPVPTPALELVQFGRYFVGAGEQLRLRLVVDARRMALLLPAVPVPTNRTTNTLGLDWWVVPGQIELSVGTSQPPPFGSTAVLTNVSIIGSQPQRVVECPNMGRNRLAS